MTILYQSKMCNSEREERDEVDRIPSKDRATNWDVAGFVFSIISHIADVFFDCNVAYRYYANKQLAYFFATLAFIIIPAIINTAFSVRMYVLDPGNANTSTNLTKRFTRKGMCILFVLIFQLAPILRYFDALKYALRSQKAEKNHDVENQRKYYELMVKEDSDVALLRVLECFLEAAPQLILQLAIIFQSHGREMEGKNTFTIVHQLLSIGSSFVSMAWAMASYQRLLRVSLKTKNNVSWAGTFVHFMWHFLVTEKRASSSRRKRTFDFDCEKCSEKFHFSTELIKHCGEVHNIPQKDVRPFGCTTCKSRFGTSSNLMQHIKYHEAVRSNVCSYCGKGFITKTDLTIHEKQHLNMREYGCNTCNKGFNTHKDLRSHKLVVHTDPILWKYLCDYCNKRFPIKSNYDCHMRRHTGEKKFECELCNRKFADKCVLQRHMRSHSNVREFQCSECDKEYKDKRVMQIHMARQHGIGVGQIKLPSKERKYICHMCPKAYYAKNKLTRHLYTHTGEKPFFCTICDKKFNDKSYVKQHIKKAHSMKIENAL